jgi:Anti-sigma factor NepR
MMANEDERPTRGSAGTVEAGDLAAALPRRVKQSRPIDAAARDRIGRGLRLHYAAVLAQPIPDRLRTLLDDLAACAETEAQP